MKGDAGRVYVLEGPVCALELGGARTTTVCPRCGRGRTVQTGDLTVELACESRNVWLSSQNAVLIDSRRWAEVGAVGRVDFRPVACRWRAGVPWSGAGLPELRQVVALQPIGASPSGVAYEDCDCGAVRKVSFKPLVVNVPEEPSAGVWYLRESPAVVVIAEGLRDVLLRLDRALEFGRAYFEGEYEPPKETAEGVRWDDLG